MPIEAVCSCGAKYRVNDTLAGKSARCKKCNSVFKIPAPSVESDFDDILNVSHDDAALPGQTPITKKRAVRPGDPKAKKRRASEDDSPEKIKVEDSFASPYGETSLEQRIASREGGVSSAESASDKIRNVFFILLGLVIMWCSQYVYGYFADWEQGGGARRMHIILLIAYKVGGKIGAAIACGLLGFLVSLAGILGLLGIAHVENE